MRSGFFVSMASVAFVVGPAAGEVTSTEVERPTASTKLGAVPEVLLEGQPAAEAPPAEAGPPAEADTPWNKGWKGGVSVGLNGSSGNTESLNFRAGANARRTTDRYDTLADITYTYGTDDGEVSDNRLEANARNDWLIKDSKWRFFADAKFEYDEFTDYDVRISGHGGVGYQFIKTEKDDLIGRAGIGAYKEFGSANNDIVPEGILGVDYTHTFSKTQSFFVTANLYPQLDQWGPFRADGKAGYQIVLDESSNLLLKLGIADRYDTTPGSGYKRNDFDYFVMLGWEF